MKWLLRITAAIQLILAIRVFGRMARTRTGQHIERLRANAEPRQTISILVPVLDEVGRLAPCLESLRLHGAAVREIIVVDGGSADGTQVLVRNQAHLDDRVRLIDATPVPPGVNGKAYGLMVGSRAASHRSEWLLTIDADVRLRPGAVEAIVAHAEHNRLNALSVATSQRIHGRLLAWLHPAMLTTLVYRFGIPGHAIDRMGEVQANGQCFLVRPALLDRAGGFERVLGAIAEDVTLARIFVGLGEPVGFYESDGLVEVEMHTSGMDAWRNWPRSLPLRDRYVTWQSDVGLAEALFVQAAPPALLAASLRTSGARSFASQVQIPLIAARFGVLIGTARAYQSRPGTYWLSPLADLPVTLEIIRRSRQKSHVWRGRTLVPGDPQ